MQDVVADVLAERAALDRNPAAAIVLSVLLHALLTGLAVYGALHASPPQATTMVNIQFAKMPGPAASAAAAKKSTETAPAVKAPEPEPKIAEPKPDVEKKPAKAEKNTVPFSPFGRSTKKGSEAPPAAKPAPAPAARGGSGGSAAGGIGTADVPIGGAGVTGLEGGDFPYTLYIQGMQRKIGANWFRPQMTGGQATVVYFRILRDGTISEAKIETSSGNGTFDRAALSAVRSSTPLTPLPFAYNGTYLGVHLTFR